LHRQRIAETGGRNQRKALGLSSPISSNNSSSATTPVTPANNDLEVRGIRALEDGNAIAKYESNVRRYEKLIDRLKCELKDSSDEVHNNGLKERIQVLNGVLNDLLEKGM
jgi:hypothetical protein